MAAWMETYKSQVEKSIDEQCDAFLERFTLQVSKQGKDAKAFVKQNLEIAEEFKTKVQEPKKNLQVASLELGKVYEKFFNKSVSMKEKNEIFGPFDLDNNKAIDVLEFLLCFHKEDILAGYRKRNDVELVDNEAHALMEEMVSDPVFVDTKRDAAILELKKLKVEYASNLEKLEQDAKSKIQKTQLPGKKEKLKTDYESSTNHPRYNPDKLSKSLKKIKDDSKAIVEDNKAILKQEDEEARGPQKK